VTEPKASAPKKSTSARKKAEVARAEKKDEVKTVDFRGLKLHLPKEPPGTLLFDIADLEGGREFQGMMELIKSLIGEGQYEAVRSKIRADGLSISATEDALAELVNDMMESTGLKQGE
jgi:hypothetical protein